ncbi:ABC transporter ATP-binding protein [Kaistia sp. 32K]|uniref:ATP-binding cassette domain-containing protein n=1 Tax=Kaistia sp. 32K TaxID=2795690 RepID=UPI001915E850|nr:ATP-binding cassette domain-containing protein [Kaistia sp. 32K]BCP55919.1 ABC transporter ATP-binding protein [Kaistia sp. 32K]
MLEIEGLSLHFRRYDRLFRHVEAEALTAISLRLAAGEVLAIVGASGSGKSLLAHSIFGILPGNAVLRGTIRFDGKILDPAAKAALCGRRIGLVPQSVSYLDPLARNGDQLRWAAARSGRPRAEIGNLADAALKRFGLNGDVARAFPHSLSGGMARRLAMAIATIGQADLVVADEPTNGLDPENAERVLDSLAGLAGRGKGVMLITHDLVSALPYADRVAVMDGGRLIDVEPASAFTGCGDRLRSAYARALWRALPQNEFGDAEASAAEVSTAWAGEARTGEALQHA